jgi:hypothetical protein
MRNTNAGGESPAGGGRAFHMHIPDSFVSAPIKDYAMPGLKHEGAATGVAGAIGVLGTFAFAYGTARLLRKPTAEG